VDPRAGLDTMVKRPSLKSNPGRRARSVVILTDLTLLVTAFCKSGTFHGI